jgi:uncharacterized protein (DUF1697 family)
MPKYVAFLRAINVGGHTVRMDQLRGLFEALGFSNVETFIASGNVIFDSRSKSAKALETKIEKCLHDALGYEVRTFIRSTSELAAIAKYAPFKAAALKSEGSVLYIAFLEDSPGDEAKQKLLPYITETDDLHVSGRELYWLCRTKMMESQFSGARLEKLFGMRGTFRNSTTVKKIASKYG